MKAFLLHAYAGWGGSPYIAYISKPQHLIKTRYACNYGNIL